jgi:hypothetical protein
VIAANPTDPTHATHVAAFERFFRRAASLDIDKQDLKRYVAFINHKIGDLLLRAEATASANGRDIIEPLDLPITKGLQECIHHFDRMVERDELAPVLDRLLQRPPLDRAPSEDTEAQLVSIAGGLSLALAQSFKIIDPEIKNPNSESWQRSFVLFDLLL